MKSSLKRFFAMFAMMFMVVALVAGCGDKEITSLKVKEGTLEYVYKEDSEFSFDGLKVIAKYNDDSTEEVGKDKLTISEFSTENVGNYDVTITYKEKTITVTLKVTNNEDELYGIYGVEKPTSLVLRDSAKGTQTNVENEFYVKDGAYVVGDDNKFTFFPKITALNDQDQLITINAFKSVANVYLKDEGTDAFELLEDATAHVVVDDVNQTYDFTEAAVGNTYKIEVRPYWLTEEQLLTVNDFTTSIEVEVVDGYNVTNAKELVVMTNFARDTDIQTVEDATTFLANNGIAAMDVNGIVLHNNITVTANDLPANYFETVSGTTYLKDYVDLYSHKVDAGKTFTFYGNYYTVDLSQLPKANIKAGQTSHATAFRLYSVENSDPKLVYPVNSYVRDTAFIGNANRSEDVTKTAGIAGLIMLKVENHTANIENCLMRTFFLNLMTDNRAKTVMNINHTKAYDSYQNSLFVWGGVMNVTNSEFKRAGGPLAILQHHNVEEYGSDEATDALIDSYAPELNIGENCVMESFVTGHESWFATMGATDTVAFLAALSRTFDGKAKTYAIEVPNAQGKPVPAMNLVAVTMAGGESFDAVVNGSKDAKGSITLNGDVVVSKFDDNMNTLKTSLAQVPFIQRLVNATVLNVMYEQIQAKAEGDPVMQGTLAALEITSPANLGAFINDDANRASYATIAAGLNKALEGVPAEGIEIATKAYFEYADSQKTGASLLYQLVSTYDAQVSSSDNVQAAIAAIMEAAPVFQSTEGGFGFLYSEDMETFSLNDNGNNLYKGDYLGIYYLGMGITLGYYDTASN